MWSHSGSLRANNRLAFIALDGLLHLPAFPVPHLRDPWKPAIWFVSSQYMSGPISFFVVERSGGYGRGLAFAHAVYDLFSRWICETYQQTDANFNLYTFIKVQNSIVTVLPVQLRHSSRDTAMIFYFLWCVKSHLSHTHTGQVVSTVCAVKVLGWKLLLVCQVFGATRH